MDNDWAFLLSWGAWLSVVMSILVGELVSWGSKEQTIQGMNQSHEQLKIDMWRIMKEIGIKRNYEDLETSFFKKQPNNAMPSRRKDEGLGPHKLEERNTIEGESGSLNRVREPYPKRASHDYPPSFPPRPEIPQPKQERNSPVRSGGNLGGLAPSSSASTLKRSDLTSESTLRQSETLSENNQKEIIPSSKPPKNSEMANELDKFFLKEEPLGFSKGLKEPGPVPLDIVERNSQAIKEKGLGSAECPIIGRGPSAFEKEQLGRFRDETEETKEVHQRENDSPRRRPNGGSGRRLTSEERRQNMAGIKQSIEMDLQRGAAILERNKRQFNTEKLPDEKPNGIIESKRQLSNFEQRELTSKNQEVLNELHSRRNQAPQKPSSHETESKQQKYEIRRELQQKDYKKSKSDLPFELKEPFERHEDRNAPSNKRPLNLDQKSTKFETKEKKQNDFQNHFEIPKPKYHQPNEEITPHQNPRGNQKDKYSEAIYNPKHENKPWQRAKDPKEKEGFVYLGLRSPKREPTQEKSPVFGR